MAPDVIHLRSHLDRFLRDFPRELHLDNDPVQFVRRYDDPRDREITGLLAAVFAYGNVKIVRRTVEQILGYLGDTPYQAVADFDFKRDLKRLKPFYHRFNTSRDLAALLWILHRTVAEYGSIETAFTAGLAPGAPDTGDAIEAFSAKLLSFGHEQFYPRGELRRRLAVRYFFPRPSQGSACKRLNLFLRWMVRPEDGIDCGVWSRVSPGQLVIPVDTHIARISSYIGLTSRKSPGWAMAMDITTSLRALHREDPLRYDFALCHLGIAGDCPRKRDPVKCLKCPIQAICRL